MIMVNVTGLTEIGPTDPKPEFVNINSQKPDCRITIGEQLERRREPDAVQWLDDVHLVTANEGDKIEGFAIDAAGSRFAVTDNDGVDESNGETLFFAIGQT